MLPILVSIGPFHLYTYVIFLIIAFFAGLFVIWKRGREAHFDEIEWFGSILAMGLIGIISARVVYSIFSLILLSPKSLSEIAQIISRTGFSSLGALAGMMIYFWIQAKKKKWDFWSGLDVIVVGISIMKAISSVGEFIGGIGYGMPTNLFFGVYFTGIYDKRIPVQIFETIWFGLLFVYLWKAEANWRTISWYKGTKSEALSGFIVSIFCLMTGIGGLLAALMRSPQGFLYGIRLDFCLPILMMVTGLVILHFRSGLGLLGILRYFLRDWGLTGSLIDNWQRRRKKDHNEHLKFGDDIFS